VRLTRYRCILLIYIQLLDLWQESRASPYHAERSMGNCLWACRFLERLSERRASCNWPTLSSNREGPPSELLRLEQMTRASSRDHHRKSDSRAKQTLARRRCRSRQAMEIRTC